jgi:hypothetical protein
VRGESRIAALAGLPVALWKSKGATVMSKTFKALVLMILGITALAGCRSMTGRSAGTFLDDANTSAKVKSAIASVKFGTVTQVDVDTSNGVVYLTGSAVTEDSKQHILQAARGAAEGKPVVDHLTVSIPRAAAPSTLEPLNKRFSRIESEPGGTDAKGRFVAYDKSGNQVATIYSIAAADLRRGGIAALDTGDRRVDHVSVYPHPGSDGMQYHVVLWHVNRQQAEAQ